MMKFFLLFLVTQTASATSIFDKIITDSANFTRRSSAPSSPVTGQLACYALASDGRIYCKNSAGVAKYLTYSTDVLSASTMTTLGDLLYEDATPTPTRLAGNTTSTKKFLSQTGTGAISAVPVWAQPVCSDISNASASCATDATNATNITSGTLPNARLPTSDTTNLGGVRADACLAHNFLNSLDTSGHLSCSQPAFSDLTGTATAAQLPNPSSSSLGGIQSAAAQSNKWINSISTSGVPSLTQPAFTDISGSVAATQMPAHTGDVTSSAGAVALTIAANAVTNAKAAQMANATFKCRTTAGTGNSEDCTATQSTALLNNMVGDSGSGGTKGLAPAPGAGDAAAGKFLKADGTYAVPAGSGGVGAITSWTPTWTNGGAPTCVSFYIQMGKWLRAWGSCTGGSFSSGSQLKIDIPSGFTIDSTKLNSSTLGKKLGISTCNGQTVSSGFFATSTNALIMFYDGSDTARLYFAYSGSASGYTKGAANGFACSSTAPLDFDFEIPVT